MTKKNKVSSGEIGLAIGLIFGKYLFKTNDLHYGYWTGDLKVDIANMPRAQEQHSELIVSRIPVGTTTVLDVGCGAGTLAARLIARGYDVDCVSPSRVLTEEARKKVGDKVTIYETKFENLSTDRRYDLVVFSESFQYIPLKAAVEQSLRFLKPGGHLLICDFFETVAPGESPLGGGHKLKEFYETVATYPLAPLADVDITKEMAPNLDLVDDMLRNLGQPVWNLLLAFFESRHPLLSRLASWKFRAKMDRMRSKYFSGRRNGVNFAIHKSYRLLLYARRS